MVLDYELTCRAYACIRSTECYQGEVFGKERSPEGAAKNGRPFFGNTPKDEKNSFITFYHYILGRFWLSRLYRWAPQFFETWL